MKLLLVFLLVMVVLGLFTERLNQRTYLLVAGASVMTTALFFGFQRFWL
jgi:hypothetical protein